MNFLGFNISRVKPQAIKPAKDSFKRSFTAAALSRLQADWKAPQTSADAEIRFALPILRGRARELERNNETVEGWLGMLENKVLGASGVQLEMNVVDRPNGPKDTLACDAIKAAWRTWGKRDTCTMSGLLCWRDVEGMALRSTARDGGLLVREIKTAPNIYGYSLDIMEIDQLDTDYHTIMRGSGNEVRFGVEMDNWGRPVAYHVKARHPGDSLLPERVGGNRTVRVNADELIHMYWMQRPKQTVGITWMASVLNALHHLGQYSEAELIASRISACKGYAIEQDLPNGYNGDVEGDDNREDVEPGMALFLDPGQRYKEIDPKHPNSNFGNFVKTKLRGVAAALGMSYSTIASDLEAVNYSSMRAGKLDEQEEFMTIQEWLIESLHERVFENWLESSLMRGAIKMPNGAALPFAKFDKFNAPDWKPRRWPWVDPQKDITAAIMAINNRLKSRRGVIAEMGGDIDSIDREQKQDGDLDFVAKPVQGAIIQDQQASDGN